MVVHNADIREFNMKKQAKSMLMRVRGVHKIKLAKQPSFTEDGNVIEDPGPETAESSEVGNKEVVNMRSELSDVMGNGSGFFSSILILKITEYTISNLSCFSV